MTKLTTGSFVVFSLAFSLQAQILLSGGTYSQAFDSLATAGTVNPWTDNSTLPGWYASSVNGFGGDYRAGAGTSTTGDLYSFGTGISFERSLGSLVSGTPGNIVYGLRLRNDTATAYQNFTISYAGEQWRDASTTLQTLRFSYRTSASPITSPDVANAPGSGGWIAFTALDFTSPQNGIALAIDGNASANRTLFSSVALTGVTLNSNEELFIRWFDQDDTSSDHGLGIDNFIVSFTPVPEPHEYAMVAGVALLGFAAYRRRLRRCEPALH